MFVRKFFVTFANHKSNKRHNIYTKSMENTNRDIVRKRIVEVASNMLLKSSCRQITMDIIAKEMGISKRTIYEIFSDKEKLLEKCMV